MSHRGGTADRAFRVTGGVNTAIESDHQNAAPANSTLTPGRRLTHARLLCALFRPNLKSRLNVLFVVILLAGLGVKAIWLVRDMSAAALLTTAADFSDYQRDFISEYFLAKAAFDRQAPYVSMVVLTERYLPESKGKAFPHPTPHPPTLIALIWPLGLLSYDYASRAWLWLELLWLGVVALLIASDGLRRKSVSPVNVLVTLLLLLALLPVRAELELGQLMILETLMILSAWYCLRSRHDELAGLAIGLAGSLKLSPLFLVLYFLIHRRFRAALWSVFTFAAACAVAVAVFGLQGVQDYILIALPQSSSYWLAGSSNSSLFGVLARTFAGSEHLAPLTTATWAINPLACLFIGILCFALWRQARLSGETEIGFAAFVTVLVLIGPLTWLQNLVLLVWPVCIVGKRLLRLDWPAGPTLRLLLVTAALLVSPGLLGQAALTIAKMVPMGSSNQLPFAVGLPLLLPTIAMIAMLVILLGERPAGFSQGESDAA